MTGALREWLDPTSIWVLVVCGLAFVARQTLAGPRSGMVSIDDHSLKDSGGHFVGLGVTYMTALHRAKHDRTRLRSDLNFLSHRGFNYIRALSMVGWNEAWVGKEIAPIDFQNRNGKTITAWPDYWQRLCDLIDIVYDDYGMRTQLTVFADAQLMPDINDRAEHLRKMLQHLKGREHKVILLEVANEAWQNGFAGDAGITQLRELGKSLAGKTSIPVALSAPDDSDNLGIIRLYRDSGVDIATIHFSRDTRTPEGGWLPVRDPWRVNAIKGIPPASSNEPIGPGSSVAEEKDPAKLVSAAAFAWMSGLPMYVFHTDAGTFGKTRLQDKPGVSDFVQLLALLPTDIANWRRNDGLDPVNLFTLFANDHPNKYWPDVDDPQTGVVRQVTCTQGDRFVSLLIGIASGGVQLEARQSVAFQVFNPITGEMVLETKKRTGERFTLKPTSQCYLMKGRTGEIARWESNNP